MLSLLIQFFNLFQFIMFKYYYKYHSSKIIYFLIVILFIISIYIFIGIKIYNQYYYILLVF